MSELSNEYKQTLDAILYIYENLSVILPLKKADNLNDQIGPILEIDRGDLTVDDIIQVSETISQFPEARKLMIDLKKDDYMLLGFDQPPTPYVETPLIPLGSKVMCPVLDGHVKNPYVAKLRIIGQRCPIHNKYMIPFKETADE